MVVYHRGPSEPVGPMDRPNRACWARRNKLCSTWLLIGQAPVPDQSRARPNRACLTGLLITNLLAVLVDSLVKFHSAYILNNCVS